ncbi:phasin family protein [Maribius pontilimi]|uniref:Phasin family protein n=1 Tax=Palleronia pontilimi TaxID=1964209 RepID=A0A934IGM1_9RHOB|nr:phasin family protein [Palleronia pontilimi]MBJ3762747.1 phasin family protein [Palleronia pontilimi]
MAKQTQDYTKMINEMMSSFPVDMSSMQDGFKSYASFGEKMSKVALEAAEKSTEISTKWTKETLSKVSDMSVARDEPTDYAKAMTDFASAQAEMTAETMAAFAEVAKKVQMETVELMLAAGKDVSEDMTAAAKKAQKDMTDAAKKATATAK